MGTQSPSPKKGQSPSPQFSAHFYCGQLARCIKMPLGMDVGLSPGEFVLDGDPVVPPQQRGRSHAPNFRPISIVPKRLDASRCHSVGGRPQPRRVCVRWGPSPLPKRGPSPILRVDVRISKLDPTCGALLVVANFVALEQQIILVKTRSESV